ncbi:MAG: hypothetical protein IKL49_11460 [Lachnospiraceae bacterium]|nr:hypothetical protein [Lachnospiraceae bacterium]
MENRRPPLPYFMTYPLPEDSINAMDRRNDREYFRQIYPREVKRYIRIIVEVLDRMDIKESYIYDEYPDKVRLERLSDTILRLIPLEKNISRETQKNLIRVLLWEEIVERRDRNRSRNR